MTGHASTGREATGNVSTGNVSTGDAATGNVSTGDAATGNVSTDHTATNHAGAGQPEPDRTPAIHTAPNERWTVVIPVKGTMLAKSRLDVAEPSRSDLALAFALDTVSAALRADRVETVIVVTGSGTVERRMRDLGAVTVRESSVAGLNAAIEEALGVARSRVPDAPVAVLLGDLPALDPADLDAVLDRARAYPRAMVADAAGVGTVLVTAQRGIQHRLRFGGASRVAHLDAGYIELDVDAGLGLRQDIDTLDDLAAANEATMGEATRALCTRPDELP